LAKYLPFKVPYEHARPRLLDLNSPAHVSTKEDYDRMPADLLNWHIITSVSAKQVPYAVVRNRNKRRYYAAFSEALKEQGYRTNGKLLPSDDSLVSSLSPRPDQPLKGTLELLIFYDKAHDAGFDRLKRDANLVLDAVRKCHDQHQLQEAQHKSDQPQNQLLGTFMRKEGTTNHPQYRNKETNKFPHRQKDRRHLTW